MSASDYLRYLRAVKGGPTPQDIENATGVPAGAYRQIEQRYRAMGSEEELAKLATYFEVPVEELTGRVEWTRKALSAALVEAVEMNAPISLEMRSGQTLTGMVQWSDLGAALLQLECGQEVVVQRHMVDRWQIAGA
ncbi:MAG TPA: helix-turn-helix transcriptional regulator [Anaerolineae bacterium]|nr:helix-turn-helix transcriptional regulator [Anaerolineae bacterium]